MSRGEESAARKLIIKDNWLWVSPYTFYEVAKELNSPNMLGLSDLVISKGKYCIFVYIAWCVLYIFAYILP